MPNHNHTVPDHAHSYSQLVVGAGLPYGTGTPAYVFVSGTTSPAHLDISATGGNGAHNNMQPYGVLYFIIKAIR
jgi:microcystin-dependent protein